MFAHLKSKGRRTIAAVLLAPILLLVIGILVMPRVLVASFLSQAQSDSPDRAYQLTSKAFRSYITKSDFPGYITGSRELTDPEVRLTRGALRIGKDCQQKKRLVLQIGACWDGEQLSSLVFVWEEGRWKFDCVSIP